MDRSLRGLSLAFVTLGCAALHQPVLAAANCTVSGTSIIGIEVFASSPTPNGAGEYLYNLATLQCSGGKVTRIIDTSNWMTPQLMLETTKSANFNMKRAFPNSCKTHLLLLHDNFNGTVDGVSVSSYGAGFQTHYDVFAGPVFYNRTGELLCPDIPALGNTDLPGTCPITSAAPVLSSAAAPAMLVGDPVNVSNGNSYQVELDHPGLPGSQMHFARYYNSSLGNWTHTYSAALKISPTKVLLKDADGRESLFSHSGAVVTAPPRELGRLEQTASGWRYDSSRSERLHFDTAGRLTRIDRANGSYENLVYGTNTIVVSDAVGNEMTLTFNAAKRLTALVAGDLQVAYAYNPGGRVIKTTQTRAGQSHARTYHYEDTREGGWLTGITDARNVRYVTWAYDAQGRVIRNELNNAQSRYLFSYNGNLSTTVTNPLGKQATYTFQTVAGAKRVSSLAGAASVNCPSSNSTFTYDGRGLIKTRTDNKGNVTTYDYNERGLEISRTDAAGTAQARTITTEWHPSLYKPTTITEPGRTLHFEYDAQGNQTSQTITGL